MAKSINLVQIERGSELKQLLNNVSVGTLAALGITDVYIANGEIHIAADSIKPLPYSDADIADGTITIKDKQITPLTASSSLSADKITGIIDASHIQQTVFQKCVVVPDDAGRFALTTSDVAKGDTVKVTSTDKMYMVVDDTKLDSEDGYVQYNEQPEAPQIWTFLESGDLTISDDGSGEVADNDATKSDIDDMFDSSDTEGTEDDEGTEDTDDADNTASESDIDNLF